MIAIGYLQVYESALFIKKYRLVINKLVFSPRMIQVKVGLRVLTV